MRSRPRGRRLTARPRGRRKAATKHWWQTRIDPFAYSWPLVEDWLRAEPDITAKVLMQRLVDLVGHHTHFVCIDRTEREIDVLREQLLFRNHHVLARHVGPGRH